MSITEELRDWSMDAHAGWIISRVELDALHAIADRIEEQYAKERIKVYDKGVYDGIDADKDAMGYVKLPVDADRVPIHINDRLDGYGKIHRVYQLNLNTGGDWSLVDERGDVYYDMAAFTHVKPDSWERIIKDALTSDRGDAYAVSTGMMRELVERCRKLAGDAE